MPDPAGTALLELEGVTKSFGRVVVADNLSLTVGSGDIVGIVGPNGAGKTSLFGLIAGDLAPASGEITFGGVRVTRLDQAARCRLGIGRTFQVPRPFGHMTVFENVLVAVQQGAGLRRRASYAAAADVLHRTGLSAEANQQAERLGLLQRKRLELARALASGPRLLRRRRQARRGAGQPGRARGIPRHRGDDVADRPGTARRGGPVSQGGALLEVRDLTAHHGQLQALSGVSLSVFSGDVYAMIGANGAGKSTLLRAIAGLHKPTSGSILLDGADMARLRPERRVAEGIVMVPEGRRLFPSLTVEENLLVGQAHARPGPWRIERVYELFGWMRDRRGQRAAQLSGGEQQAVAIGRALVANPRVLLLDELSLGLAPVVVHRIYDLLPQLLETGVTVLVVEQDVSQALRVASRIHCLLEGRTTLEGPPG